MRASSDDSTPAPRGPCRGQHRSRSLQPGGSQLSLTRSQPSGAGSGRRVELRRVTTCRGELEFVSQQCLDYFGMTLDELKGWATSDIVHSDDLSRVLATWKSSVET